MYVAKRQDGTFEQDNFHVLVDDPRFADLSTQYGYLAPGYADVDGLEMEDHRGKTGWLNGERFKMEGFGPLPEGFTTVPPISIQAKVFESGVEQWLDAFARTRSYKDIVSAASYVASKNVNFKAEAEYAADLRDRTWEWANAYMNDVLTGQKPIPTWETFVVELATAMQPEWPVPDTRVPVGGA